MNTSDQQRDDSAIPPESPSEAGAAEQQAAPDKKRSLIDIFKASPRAKIVSGNGGGCVITGVKPPEDNKDTTG